MPHVALSWYRLSRSVVGTSRCSTSVSAWRLPPITSLPMSARPIELTKNCVEVLLLVDDGVADPCRVVGGRRSVRRRVGVGVAAPAAAASMSWLRLGRLGSILASNASKSVSVWPIFSPRPLNALEIAPSVSLSFAGSILSSTDTSCWKTVLISTVTCSASDHLARAAAAAARVSGGRPVRRTWRRTPSTMRCRPCTLDGMSCSCDGSIARCRTRPCRRAGSRSSRPCRPARRAS